MTQKEEKSPTVNPDHIGEADEMVVSDSGKTMEWKEEFKKQWIRETGGEGLPNFIIPFIETLLSSQAHALKEQMKACVPEEMGIYQLATFVVGWNECRNRTLSAIESIEI